MKVHLLSLRLGFFFVVFSLPETHDFKTTYLFIDSFDISIKIYYYLPNHTIRITYSAKQFFQNL